MNEHVATQEVQRGGVEFEQHYSPTEIGKLWNLSPDKVRKMFENEPGVLRPGEGETRYKRSYFLMRVPESVMKRVHMKWRTKSSSVN